MYVCVCTYAYINTQIHTNSYRIQIRIRDWIRNSLKSRIRIQDRIRKKSFQIHNTALQALTPMCRTPLEVRTATFLPSLLPSGTSHWTTGRPLIAAAFRRASPPKVIFLSTPPLLANGGSGLPASSCHRTRSSARAFGSPRASGAASPGASAWLAASLPWCLLSPM